jgi:hypothetical protein
MILDGKGFGVAVRVAWIENGIEGEDDIVCGEGVAVAPFDFGSEGEGIGFFIFGDGPIFSEGGGELIFLVIVGDERGEEYADGLRGVEVFGDEGIEGARGLGANADENASWFAWGAVCDVGVLGDGGVYKVVISRIIAA